MNVNGNLNAFTAAEALPSMNLNQSLLQLTIGGGGVGTTLNNNPYYSPGSASIPQTAHNDTSFSVAFSKIHLKNIINF